MPSLLLCVPVRLFVLELPHLQDSFAEKLLQVMPRLSSCNPVELVKILQTTLRQSSLLQLALPEQVPSGVADVPEDRTTGHQTVTLILSSLLLQIHRATATIIEPTGESDNPLRFTSGLVLALDIDATLEHIQDPQNTVKVQVSRTCSQTRDWPHNQQWLIRTTGKIKLGQLLQLRNVFGNVCFFRFFIPMARVM